MDQARKWRIIFFAGIMGVFLTLSLINIGLNALKVKRKGFFYGNSAFQIAMGFLLAGLFAPIGIIVLEFSFAVIASLWEKKTPEELLKHPPKPITTKHRFIVGAGVLLMLASGLISWLSPINFSIIGVYFHTVDYQLLAV